MSDEQPDDEEPTDLSALLNRHVPANPGKPRPWVPADSVGYATQGTINVANAAAGGVEEGVAESAATDNAAGYATEPTAGGGGESRAERGAGELPPSGPPPPAPAASVPGVASSVGQQDPGELSAFLADVGRLTSTVQGQLTGLQGAIESAKEQTYEVTSADESVTVAVNGRPRVTHVSVGPKALRGGPEELGAVIVEAVNAATNQARAGAQNALLDGLDPDMRAAVADAMGDGASNDSGNSGDGAGAVPRWGGSNA
jgi:DNA-binding protein YbaB